MRTNVRKGRSLAVLILGAVVALPTAALAQRYESLREKNEPNFELKALAGVTSYTGQAAAVTNPGAAYGVAAGIGITPLFDVELGYVGSAYQTEQGIEANQFMVLENGAQGTLHAAPNIGMFEPYAFGGIKVNRLSVQEDEVVSAVVNDDTQVKIPLGVGLNMNINRDGPDWQLGARGTYDATVASDAFAGLDNMSQNQLTGQLIFGGAF